MTNNRLWLVHKPSGKHVLLAKKGAEFWGAFGEDHLNEFFDKLYDEPTYRGEAQDEFVLLQDHEWNAYEGPLDPYPRSPRE